MKPLFFPALLVLMFASLSEVGSHAAERPPNVVVIFADDLNSSERCKPALKKS